MVISPEVRAKIKQLEIYTRRMLSSAHVGDFRTAVKGSGFEFESLREYMPGDDIRFIDWPATARSGKLLVRQYYEERSRQIMVILDGSASTLYGREQSRFERMREIAAVLALAGQWSKDGVGLIMFSDDITQHFPPTRSPAKIHKIIEYVYEYVPRGVSNFTNVFKKLSSLRLHNTISFVISDFIGDHYQRYLKALAQKNDIIAIRCIDQAEKEFPPFGVFTFQDPETNQQIMVDARKGNKNFRKKFFNQWNKEVAACLKDSGIDFLEINLTQSYIADLITFFKRRMLYK